jgi:hypothetical protein
LLAPGGFAFPSHIDGQGIALPGDADVRGDLIENRVACARQRGIAELAHHTCAEHERLNFIAVEPVGSTHRRSVPSGGWCFDETDRVPLEISKIPSVTPGMTVRRMTTRPPLRPTRDVTRVTLRQSAH